MRSSTKIVAAAVALGVIAGCGGQRTKVEARTEPPTTADAAEGVAPTVAAPTPPTEPPPAPAPPVAAAPAAPAAFPADCSVTPPSQAHRDILFASATDAPPELLDGVSPEKFGQHYYVSDEAHPDRFRDYIAGSGGGYVGIGSDQAYVYIGWARPQFAWTVDYDAEVVRMHQLQQAFFLAADSPDAYRTLWQRAHRDQARAIVATMTTDARELRRLNAVLDAGQARMGRRMKRLTKNLGAIPSYLTDQATYDFIRNLIRNGCVRPMLVDLLATKGMRGIGEAAAKVGLPIRTLYLSNAEEYWKYTDDFRANIRALPHDERSLALHTQASNVNQDYRYTVQPIGNFVAWLDDGWARNIDMMIGRIAVKKPTDVPHRRFEQTPAEGRAEREAKRRPRRRGAE